MSVIEKTGTEILINSPAKEKTGGSFFTRFMKLLSSVRFGVILLISLGLLCFLGMIVMQQNIEGFENYYAALTPAQKLVYGSVGLFDIYHSWYFNALLLVLSFNIVLSSIDRFPKTWTFVSKPKLVASLKFIKHQEHHDSLEISGESAEAVAARVAEKAKKAGWRKTVVTEKDGKTFVFAQSGVWNRLGAYAVHVGLLTIFIGGFMTGQFGNTGQMPLQPGQTSNQIYEMVSDLDRLNQVTKELPFEIYCTDIQQKLIKGDGALSASNTIDWLTKIQIRDETGVTNAVVQLNRPFDYRGYRFFQASFVATGRARNITVRLKAADNSTQEDVTIDRNGATVLADGTNVRFVDFRGNFSIGKEDPNEDTSSYPNPAAVLQVTPPGGQATTAYAFGEKMANIPIAQKPVAGYTFRLVDFEKVGDQHILSVQRDPGASVVYVGFIILALTLIAVFFFSHQRVWAMVETLTADGQFKVTFGGNTNRSKAAFGEKFKRFIRGFGEQEAKI